MWMWYIIIWKTSKEATLQKQALRKSSTPSATIGLHQIISYRAQWQCDTECPPQRSVGIHLQDVGENDVTGYNRKGSTAHRMGKFVHYRRQGKGLRICLDPRDLNKAIKCEHYHTRTIDDIAPKFTGATHFSVLDACSGYWMVTLDEASSLLTTFSTPFGRFKHKRLPFGLVVSQNIFQRKR
jgi:hypothetical protein